MAELTLYGDIHWESPWVFHVMIALEEMRLPYRLQSLALPIEAPRRDDFHAHALLAKVPCLVDPGGRSESGRLHLGGDFWLTESAAISEYLNETFAQAPRIMPVEIHERARARQVMSWLRTSLMALREERPTTSVFMHPVQTALSAKARRDADELIRVARQLIADRQTLFAQWTIADIDLALALMRLIANGDSLPQPVVDYALAQWGRQSVRKYLANIPTTP